MDNLKNKKNYTKLCHLLIEKGTEALRRIFDSKCPPSKLKEILDRKENFLSNLGVINSHQWDILFPARDDQHSRNFDISLLLILLRNICNLTPPREGWSKKPKDSDRSQAANILRVKLYRNEIYAHANNTEIIDEKFEDIWENISHTLTKLRVSRKDIERIKTSPLSPEEEMYIDRLKDWKIQDDKIHEKLDEIKTDTKEIKERLKIIPRDANDSLLLKLSKFNFEGDIKKSVQKFHTGTREWLFQKVETWFRKEGSTEVLVITAESGFGKTTLAAKIIEKYKSKLAACHLFKLNSSNYSKPKKMLESLANQICVSVDGFKDKLIEQLRRPNEVNNLQDAFQVYLKEPLHSLPETSRKLVVIDGLDECERKEKTELLNVLAEEFSKLPAWLKVLVTSSPEKDVKEKLSSLECIDILPTDKNNTNDIKEYLKSKLPKEKNISELTKSCEGSFLYAVHLEKKHRATGEN